MSYRLNGTTETRRAPTLSVPRPTRRRVLRSALGITAVAVGADLFQPSRHRLVFADDGGPGNPGTVVVAWNEVALQAIRASHPTPPVAARALAILHTCMYDAWAAYAPVALGTRLGEFCAVQLPNTRQQTRRRRSATPRPRPRALSVQSLPSAGHTDPGIQRSPHRHPESDRRVLG